MTEIEKKWSGPAINSVGYAVLVWLAILALPLSMAGGLPGYVITFAVPLVWIIAILDGLKAWSEIRINPAIKGKLPAIFGVLLSVAGIGYFIFLRAVPALCAPGALQGG